MKQEYIQAILSDPQFLNFLDKEFAFGSVEEAVERYVKLKEKNKRKKLV